MIKKLFKILKTRRKLQPLQIERSPVKGLALNIKRLYGGSLAIRQIDAGSDNACEQELTALNNPYYDIARLGIHFVASPRHADMLFVTGPVTRNMRQALIKAYEATPAPKFVVAVGDDAIDGGIFNNSYAVIGAVDKVIPVDYCIPGDPPSPEQIMHHIAIILASFVAKDNHFEGRL